MSSPISIDGAVVQDTESVDRAACGADANVMATADCVEATSTCKTCQECSTPEGECGDFTEVLCGIRVATSLLPPSPASTVCVGSLAPQRLGCWSRVIDSL